MWYLILKGISYVLMFSIVFAQDPVANIPQGRVMGIKAYVGPTLKPLEIYYGIPYATPPKGRYRFSAPERHGGWRRTFFAHRIPPHCPHSANIDKNHFSEDCLFLNIWTPRHSEGKSLPVVIILYNESWIKGGVTLPCQELAAEGVVVVTVMYRLHILAFFTLRTKAARGNLALLDQYMALIWVRDNIAAFGGDPTAITLLGHSAGADSVLHLITSPRTIGLFHRAIIMSPYDVWKAIGEQRIIEATDVERVSREIAHSLGCTSDTDQEILQCMRGQTLSDIQQLFLNDSWNMWMQPVPDDFLPETEQFLPKSLSVSLLTAVLNVQLDILLGATDLESVRDEKYEEILKQRSISGSYLSEYVDSVIIPKALQHFSIDTSEILPMVIRMIRWEYWTGKTNGNINALDALEIVGRIESSANWSVGIALLAAKIARKVGRLYVYRYSQPSGVDLRGRKYNFTGAVHGSDLVSLLGDSIMSQVARRSATIEEKRISSLFRKYVTNFIKFGSPEENKWRRYLTGDNEVFDIRDTSVDVEYYHRTDRDVKFWLEYLPEVSNAVKLAEKTEQLIVNKDESRLRGGVFAMAGVTSTLLLLLCVCAILLHRQRSRHFTVNDDSHN